ncbi:MAG TPA: hypothetical protein P5232_01265 [Candidatus Moranbacteria bacterium]|nr:hypothetical protein [Candidatus Moranbacteria bacterium]
MFEKLKPLFIDYCDGLETFTNLRAEEVFDGGMDINVGFYLDKDDGYATARTSVKVYRSIEDISLTFSQLFGLFSRGDINELRFTQAQVIGFARKYYEWLKTDYGSVTFFLCKSRKHFLIAHTFFNASALLRLGGIVPFGDDTVYNFAKGKCRVVIPRLVKK